MKGETDMKRVLKVASIPVLLLGFLFTLISPLLALAKEADFVKVGVLMPLSGGGAPWGIGVLRGVELMADKINGEGGIKVGDKKYQVSLIKSDTKSDFNVSLAQANKMIFSDNIKYIIGPILSGEALSAQTVTERNKVIMMSLCGTPKFFGADKPYSFKLNLVDPVSVSGIFVYLSKHLPGVKKIALVGPNNESGWGSAEVARELAKRAGTEIVAEDFLQPGATDYFPMLGKMIPKNPDAIFILATPAGQVAMLLQQGRQLGYNKLMISTTYADPQIILEKAGDAAEGYIFQSMDFEGPWSTQGHRELHKNYLEKYKETFNTNSGAGYPMLYVLKLAIEKAGTFDSTAVAKAMENLEGEMPYGRFTMGGLKTYGGKRQILYPLIFSQIKNRKSVVLDSVMPLIP